MQINLKNIIKISRPCRNARDYEHPNAIKRCMLINNMLTVGVE